MKSIDSPRRLSGAGIMRGMQEFISEPLTPATSRFDTAAMGTGLPGLPATFEWRGERYSVAEVLETWKESQPEGGRRTGERYLRRHYFRLRMSDSSTWVVYFVRTTPRSGSPKQRWFLYGRQA